MNLKYSRWHFKRKGIFNLLLYPFCSIKSVNRLLRNDFLETAKPILGIRTELNRCSKYLSYEVTDETPSYFLKWRPTDMLKVLIFILTSAISSAGCRVGRDWAIAQGAQDKRASSTNTRKGKRRLRRSTIYKSLKGNYLCKHYILLLSRSV